MTAAKPYLAILMAWLSGALGTIAILKPDIEPAARAGILLAMGSLLILACREVTNGRPRE